MMKNKVVFRFASICLTLILLSSPFNNKIAYAEYQPCEIVIEQTTGRILHSLNAEIRRPIASLTKIMTAIITIENTDIKRDFTITKECVGVEGSSIYLREGEVYTVEDLLYGLMLRSGNDAAIALAISTAGSVDSFVKLMNNKANTLKLKNTSFKNPHGLHSDEHYSTAHDVAIILCHAMKNETYRNIVKTTSYSATEKTTGEKKVFYNKNKLLARYEKCTGGKTGYTKFSGRCLASSAEKNSLNLVSVVLGCSDTYERTQKNFENAFSIYKLHELCNPSNFSYSTLLKQAKKECECYIKHTFCYPLRNEEEDDVKIEIKVDKQVLLPVKKDKKIGIMEIYLKNQLLFSQNIYTIEDVEKKFEIKDPIDNWI